MTPRRLLRCNRLWSLAAAARFNPCPSLFNMTEAPSSSIWSRSPLARFFHWLFSWRGLRRVLIVMAWAATIIVLLYGFENWRGRRAWKKHEQQLLARGEKLDFKAFFSKPVPDEQNFAASPFVASWSIK